jgi:hypothetical protein
MTTKVTVYLNEAAVSFFGFKPFKPEKAALRKAISFELDRDIRFASAHGKKATNEDIARVLDIVYIQLNVGGDIYPHTTWSQSYRDLGNRSLSLGDVVHLDGGGFFVVSRFGFKEIMAGVGGAHRVRKAQERYAAEFGTVQS